MTSSSLLSTAPATLLALRAALLTRPDLDTVFTLRDAGYAGGESLYQAFDAHVRAKDLIPARQLDVQHFFRRAGEFLTQCGWGTTTFAASDESFCVIEIEGCWEAIAEHQPEPRGCHLTVGLLGAFLGHFADYAISVLETEGADTGSSRTRFLAGNTDMVADYYAAHS